MSRRLVLLITVGLTLSGCCAGNGPYFQPTTTTKLTSWDKLASHPVRDKVKSAKAQKKSETIASGDASPNEPELAALKPYSQEWWSVRDAIDRASEAKLAKKLIICRGCMPKPDDQTGSVASK